MRDKISIKTELRSASNESNQKIIEGYFIRFNEEIKFDRSTYEEIDPRAVNESLKKEEIKVLFNHDASVVLGSKSNNTANFRVDEKGLWATVLINDNDKQALDIYARVLRGDIDKASCGFIINEQELSIKENGSKKITIKDMDLLEVSIVTFPAYNSTEVSARDNKKLKSERIKKDFKTAKLEGFEERKKEALKSFKKLSENIEKKENSEIDIKVKSVIERALILCNSDEHSAREHLDNEKEIFKEVSEELEGFLKACEIEVRNSKTKYNKCLDFALNAESEQELKEAQEQESQRRENYQTKQARRDELIELRKIMIKASDTIYGKTYGMQLSKDPKEKESGNPYYQEVRTIKKGTTLKTTKGEKRENMNTKKMREQRESFNAFIETRGATTNGLTTDETTGGVLVPQELITSGIEKGVKDPTQLADLVDYVQVNRGTGKYPIMKNPTLTLTEVAELAVKELKQPEFTNISYDVRTYRGSLPVSEELIQDSEVDVLELILKYANLLKTNTVNAEIGKILKTFTAKEITNDTALLVNDLKDVVNNDLAIGYEPSFVVTQSAFSLLDKLKDENDHYILQADVSSPTGRTLLGHPLIRVKDELLGAKGDLKLAVVDLEKGITYFDRNSLGVAFPLHITYGRYLMAATRLDVKQTDKNAGFFVNIVPSV